MCQQLQNGGMDIIVDISSQYVTNTIRSMAEAMGIPHIASVDPSFYELDTRLFNTSVNTVPPESVLLHSIRDIVSHENLTNVAIIYDDTFSK